MSARDFSTLFKMRHSDWLPFYKKNKKNISQLAEQTTEIPKQRKIEEKYEKIKTEVKSEPEENAKAKSPGKGEKSFKPVTPPENWSDMLENIRKMREKRDAPVDTMGCQKCYEGQDFISSILKKNL